MSGARAGDPAVAKDAAARPAAAPVEPPAGAVVRIGRFFFGKRDFVFTAVFLLLAVASRPLPFGGSPGTDRWLNLAGVLTALSGQVLRAAVIGLAYIRRGGKDKKIYADDLVTDGFFAHSRNPLYLGNMLVYLGLFLVLNSTIGWLVGVPFFLVAYLCITAAEEEYLGRRFGAAYEDYRRRVPRFFPRLAGLGETMRGMRFHWRRVIRKEYGSTYAWAVTVLALLAYERVTWAGSAAAGPDLRRIALAWGGLTVLYGIARWLKKTHRIDDV